MTRAHGRLPGRRQDGRGPDLRADPLGRPHAPTRSWSRAGATSARASSAGKYGIAATLDNAEAARWAARLVLMAKPQDMERLLAQIRAHVTPRRPGDQLRRRDPDVVRREAPARGRAGRARDVERAGDGRRGDVGRRGRPRRRPTSTSAIAEELLGYVGKVLRLNESHLDAVTATSGSGPAYFFLLAEAMIEACILLGLSRDVATELIIQTMLGLGEDAARHGQAPGGAPRDGDLAGRHHDRGDPPSRGSRACGPRS